MLLYWSSSFLGLLGLVAQAGTTGFTGIDGISLAGKASVIFMHFGYLLYPSAHNTFYFHHCHLP